ncbi:MAG: signal peptidase II [Candidatus Babeliaceae bacterium]|nr:signal peptidase II [Candidatus Babeliaceae bacterium]
MIKRIFSVIGALTFFTFILAIDFLSKQWALKTTAKEVILNQFVTLELLINRGISWGIFHHATQPFFIALSVAISLVVVLLVGYTVFRFVKGFPVYAELLVIAGATGNLIDRALYNGVVDFIVFHIGPYSLPVFNVADGAIIIGVLCIVATMHE